MNRLVIAVVLLAGCSREPEKPAGPEWPPKLDKPYPDLELVDQAGQKVKLSSFKGRVILVETVGMNCSACQAFAGAHETGAFEGVAPQKGLESIEKLFAKHAGIPFDDSRFVFVQLLLYSMSMKAPTADDARRWAEHFGMERSGDRIVLAGEPWLLGTASYDLIPGFQLIDQHFVQRSDSTGHQPRHNLYTHLLPMVGKLVEGE
jgi:hypothetical protein